MATGNEDIIPAPGTHYQNGILPQADLFVYKARECKSAPPGTLERSDSMLSQDSSISSKSSVQKEKPPKKDKSKKKASLTFGKIFYFLFGHAPEFTAWATSYSSSSRIKYLSLFFVESALRSIGDITFCSNPFSGLLIFIGMLISCPKVAFLAFITLTSGIETAVVFLRIPMEEVRSGVVLFNNYLTGTVVGLLAHEDVIVTSPQIIAVCMVVGILTVIIWRGLNGSLASKLEFPMLNAPFHVMILLYIFSGIAAEFKLEDANTIHTEGIKELPVSIRNLTFGENTTSTTMNLVDISGINGTIHMYLYETDKHPPSISKGLHGSPTILKTAESLNWEKVLHGIFLAPSPVFGTNSLVTSGLVHAAVLIYSPTMMVQSLTGAAIGTMIGVCLATPDGYEALYDGHHAYNPLFTSAALGGFLVIFNVHSWLLSIVGSIITALLYSAMVKCNVPALGIPFMLTTWLLLPSAPGDSEQDQQQLTKEDVERKDGKRNSQSITKNGPFYRLRLSDITTPEWNRRLLPEYSNSNSDKYNESQNSSTPQQNAVLPL